MLDVLKFVEVIISILLTFVVLVQNKSVSLNLANMSGGMATITKR
jgi:preprotein translocase subunit SecG